MEKMDQKVERRAGWSEETTPAAPVRGDEVPVEGRWNEDQHTGL